LAGEPPLCAGDETARLADSCVDQHGRSGEERAKRQLPPRSVEQIWVAHPGGVLVGGGERVGESGEGALRVENRGDHGREPYGHKRSTHGMKYVLALILGFALVAGAAAKDGVVAHLENPGALRGASGTKVTLVWKLRDADRHPFGASGIYVRLHGLST